MRADVCGPMIEDYGLQPGDRIEWRGRVRTVIEVRHFGAVLEATGGDADLEDGSYIHRSQFFVGLARRLGPPTPSFQHVAFGFDEVQAILAHGADRYASQAMVCDEERARVDRESRAWWNGYKTEGDIRRISVEWTLWSSRKRREENSAWRQTFTRPLDHEMPGDYAQRHDIPWDRNLWPTREEFFVAVRAEMAAVAAGEPVDG